MDTNSGDSQRNNINYVQQDGRFKEIIFMERLTRNNWETNWGFMKDFGKMFKEELARRGLTLEPPRSRDWIFKRHVPEPAPSPPFPVTSSGMVGWRASKPECKLENFGPLYISPKLTIDPPPEPGVERYPFGQLTIFIDAREYELTNLMWHDHTTYLPITTPHNPLYNIHVTRF